MRKFWEKISKFLGEDRRSRTWTLIWGGLLVYILLAAAQAIWQNYRIEQEIITLQKEVAALEEEKQSWLARIAYYKTEAFKEREARRKLNYQKPGEEVLVIPRMEMQDTEEGVTNDQMEEEENRPNILRWWDFFFG